jgi:hypothetical protein
LKNLVSSTSNRERKGVLKMSKKGKTVVILTLAMAFCFVLVWLVLAGSDDSGAGISASVRIITRPIWQITQEGTDKSVKWVDHAPNPRFAIYDAGTPGDETDDVVLDKETGLVWQRAPSTGAMTWYDAFLYSYPRYLGGRKGWRLPTEEELASLVDPDEGPPTLPSGHPFINVSPFVYWSSTTRASETTLAWDVDFGSGGVGSGSKTGLKYVWCVRGGQGNDGY